MVFRDRSDAGRILAKQLRAYADRPDVIVLGLPRGGVPVAFEVAKALRAPLDVFIVRKLGTPGEEELAMGAIASGGVRVLNRQVILQFGVSRDSLDAVAEREYQEIVRRERLYRHGRPFSDVRGKTAILIDDGLATGSTMRAAVSAVRQLGPARAVVAVPTAAADTCQEFQTLADDVVCLETPEPFYSVGSWYEDFTQTTDAEVRKLLAAGANPHA